MFRIEVCFDAIKLLLAARCTHPFTNGRFPPATLISTLRIFKEQATLQPQTSTSRQATSRRRAARCSGLQPSRLSESKAPPALQPGYRQGVWWRMTGSNRRPPACKAGALPAELIPQAFSSRWVALKLVGLVGFEPTTPALSRRCSNRLSYRPNCIHSCLLTLALELRVVDLSACCGHCPGGVEVYS